MRSRAGFTVVELVVGLVLFAVVAGSALMFFQTQVRSFAAGAERTTLTQSAQFAASVLRRDLRTAGTNVLPQQPWLVYAGEEVIAFSADYASNTVDPFAVYVDPDLPTGERISLRRSERFTLPRTTFAFPDTTYWAAPTVPGSAELLVFFFAQDSTTPRTDDFTLYRQVNRAAPEPIAQGLLRSDTTPFFQYYRHVSVEGGEPSLQLVGRSLLPMRHTRPLHLSASDTGAFARVDSVRAVRFTFAGSNGRTGSAERRVNRSMLIWMRNGGLASSRSCGSPPIFGSGLSLALDTVGGEKSVRISWSRATDESAGEDDVIRYVMWRYAPGTTPADPYLSIPAGSSSYVHSDRDVRPGESWMYRVAAQDCTPSLSTVVDAGPIVITP